MKHNIVLEYSSKELLALSKRDTPERFKRRLDLGATKVMSATLDYKTGNAVITLLTHRHEQRVQIEDFIDLVSEEIIEKHSKGIRREDLMRIINVAVRLLLEEGDVLVDCDCEDYKFRFNWLAKQYGFALIDRIRGFNYAPNKANPKKLGGICKHITKVLSRESQWAEAVSRKLINEILKYKEFAGVPIVSGTNWPEQEEETTPEEQGVHPETEKEPEV